MKSHASNSPDEIRTTSRIQAWLLSVFRGYAVKTIIRSNPKAKIFGGIKYHTLWVLTPPTDGAEKKD